MKGVGYPLVPEHVETRSLWSPRIPGIAQVSMGKFSSVINNSDILPKSWHVRIIRVKKSSSAFYEF